MKKKLYCLPLFNESNKYIEINKKYWKEIGFNVVDYGGSVKNILTEKVRRDDALVLNWVEDRPAQFTFFKSFINFSFLFFILIVFRFKFDNVYWIKHNLRPHSNRGVRYYKVLSWLMRSLRFTCLTHAPVDKLSSCLIPHPLYFEGEVPRVERDIEYLYFGSIDQYKSIDKLLLGWPSSKKLVIAGACNSDSYYVKLNSIINDRCLQVEWYNRFIKDDELNEILKDTKFVIIPHQSESIIVSGTFYHAASFGCNVIMPNTPFYRYLSSMYSFVHVLRASTLLKDLCNINYIDCSEVLDQVRGISGSKQLKDCWRDILSK